MACVPAARAFIPGNPGQDAWPFVKLTDLQLDALSELINIGCGKAAGALSRMTRADVELFAPEITVLDECQLAEYADHFNGQPCDVTALDFSGALAGRALLLLVKESADNLVSLLTRGMGGTPDAEMRADALRETGNVVLVFIAGAMANVLGHALDYSPLRYGQRLSDMLPNSCDPNSSALLIKAGFSLRDELVNGDVLFLFPAPDFGRLMTAVNRLIGEVTG